jgi:hypothetical protein
VATVTRLLVDARIAPCSETEALAVRHACDVAMEGAVWRESFAPGAFIVGGAGAKVTARHDGPTIGHVALVVDHGGWHVADLVLDLEDDLPDLIQPGRPVSIDARSIRRDDDEDLHIRRHTLVQLQAVALLADGERPWYPEAKIISVRQLPARREPTVGVECHGEPRVIVRHGIGQMLGVR